MAEYPLVIGYPSIYSPIPANQGNGINSLTQIRRSADMVYQRGGTYEVIVGSNTLIPSMELTIDMFANDELVGNMSIVPYDISVQGPGGYDYKYYYKFNVRPYNYMSNYIKSQHYKYYWKDDWTATNYDINYTNPYPNSIKANYKYGFKFYSGSTAYYEQSGGNWSQNKVNPKNLNHYTSIPFIWDQNTFVPSGYTNTGNVFNLVGGAFQFNNNYILPNYDQEVGTVIPKTGYTLTNVDLNKRLSPMSQYLMDYPSLPAMSETARFLTDAPRIQYIQSDENYVLSFLNGTTGDLQVIEANYATFRFFDVNNTQIHYFEDYIPTNNTYLKVYNLPCGPVDIEEIWGTYYLPENFSWSNVAYYSVQLAYGNSYAAGPTSEAFNFYIYDNCKPENTRLAFLNQRGGFDYFTFTAYRQDTNKTKAETYDSRYYSPNLPAADRDFGRTVKTFATDVDQEIVLESDYINIETSNWLEQLFSSPQIYIMDQDYVSPIDVSNKIYKDLTPVQLLSTSVEKFTRKHQKLNKYKITLKTANTYFVSKGF